VALTRTARLQRQARWTLAIIAALVMAGIGLVYWQYWAISNYKHR